MKRKGRGGASKKRAVLVPRNGPARGSQHRVLRAADLMSRNPVIVPDHLTIGELCDLFQEKNINGAPVVDHSGRLVGVVAQDDIIYGAMGHPERMESGSPGNAGTATRTDPAGELGSAGRKSRRMVAMLRERKLEVLPDPPPRPGEAPFWAEDRKAADPLRRPVSAIMTSPAISAEEETPVTELCNVMWNLKIHRVPIVRGGRVTGLVSSMDLCRAILSGLIKV